MAADNAHRTFNEKVSLLYLGSYRKEGNLGHSYEGKHFYAALIQGLMQHVQVLACGRKSLRFVFYQFPSWFFFFFFFQAFLTN